VNQPQKPVTPSQNAPPVVEKPAKPTREVKFGVDFPSYSAKKRPKDEKIIFQLFKLKIQPSGLKNYNDDEFIRGTQPIYVVKTDANESTWNETASLELGYQAPGDSFYGGHFARRGIVLADGSFFDSIYRYSYIVNTEL